MEPLFLWLDGIVGGSPIDRAIWLLVLKVVVVLAIFYLLIWWSEQRAFAQIEAESRATMLKSVRRAQDEIDAQVHRSARAVATLDDAQPSYPRLVRETKKVG